MRAPAVAGSFYPASRLALREQVRTYLADLGVPDQPLTHPVGGLVPHAGYVYSGAVAGLTFQALARCGRPGLVVLVGVNHTGMGPRAPALTREDHQTPLGVVSVDQEACDFLIRHGVQDAPEAHLREHSLEVQLPFVQTLYPGVKIVTITMSGGAAAQEELTRGLADLGSQHSDLLLIGSGDLIHMGATYGFVPVPGAAAERLAWMQERDRAALRALVAMDLERFAALVDRDRLTICGRDSFPAVVGALKRLGLGPGRELAYRTSHDVSGDPETVVGYGAVAYTEMAGERLSSPPEPDSESQST